MSKVVAITAAVLVSAGFAAGPAFAKKHHHHHMAAAEPAVMLPAPLIGGHPLRVGSTCYSIRNSDYSYAYEVSCKK